MHEYYVLFQTLLENIFNWGWNKKLRDDIK